MYSFGIGYDASEKFIVSAEIQKEEDQPVNVNAGLQYKFIPQLLVRAGMSSATSAAWLGLGLTIKSFRLDVTTSYHPQLGITPGVLMLFNFNRKAKLKRRFIILTALFFSIFTLHGAGNSCQHRTTIRKPDGCRPGRNRR
ncbi:MAG: hypothetical protein V9F01_07495 [Chitinophagaceae bacterium]